MKRMKKKVVAMVTLAMFMMTLLPMAAFAADTDVDVAKSTYKVEASNDADKLGNVTVTVNLKNAAGEAATSGNDAGQVKVKLAEVAKEATLETGATNMSAASGIDAVKNGVSIDNNQYSATFTLKNVPAGSQVVKLQISTDSGASYTDMTAENSTVVVPVAADRQTSNYLTEKSNPTVDIDEEVVTTFEINDNAGNPTKAQLKDVVVWAVEKGHDITDASSAVSVKPAKANYVDNQDVTLKFARAGEYTIYAGVVENQGSDTLVESASKHLLGSVENHQVVTVAEAAAGDVKNVVISNADKDVNDDKVYTANKPIKPNNTATATHTVSVTGKDDKVLKDKEFTVTTSNSNIQVTAKDMDDNAFEGNPVTNRNGEFKITYKVAKAGDYKIYLTSEDGYKVTLKVSSADQDLYVDKIANADFDASVVDKDDLSQNAYLSDAVRFVITDNKGNVLDPAVQADKDLVLAEPAAQANVDYISLAAPDKFKGEAKNFKLAVDDSQDPKVFTLQYTGKHKFVVGDYTVRVALEDNGNYVDAKFTVGDFDDNAVKEIKVVPTEDTVEYNAKEFTFKVKAVDNNGVEKDITGTGDYTIGVNANSILGAELDTSNANKVLLKNKADVTNKADYVGNVITLTAVSDKYTSIATAEVTVIDDNNDLAAGLAFDSENGAANKDNKVAVSVVDKDGKVVDGVDSKDIIVYVANQSNKDANVEVDVTKQVKDGKDGQITIYSDKETKADVVVAVKTKEAIYAGTLKYSIGAEAEVGGETTVVMTLGSSNMIVNNKVVDMKDAAPFAQNNRTYVPFRALGEALGATVDYDQTAKTVSYKLGSNEIVMTLDSKTYTVNGAEKTMDVAPFAKNERTYVPVRFVGEALGFDVTGLQNANGKYVAVAFTK